MRIKIEGSLEPERVLSVLKTLMKRAPAGSHITGFNMYLTVRDKDWKEVEFLNDEGRPMESLVFQEPRTSVSLPARPNRRAKADRATQTNTIQEKPALRVVGGKDCASTRKPAVAAAANQ
jgi:hypothetical protein